MAKRLRQKNFAFAGPTREIPRGQDRPILPARVANQNTQAPRAGKMKRNLRSDSPPPILPLGIARFVPAKAKLFGVIFWPYNKSFIDQACSVKMVGYWPRSFLRFYAPRRKELGQYPAILTDKLGQ